MITLEIHGSGSELLDRFMSALAADDKPADREDLVGLERKPREMRGGRRCSCGCGHRREANRERTRADEAVLLTVRRDLMEMRDKALRGADANTLLGEIDYTIDQLDNALAEM